MMDAEFPHTLYHNDLGALALGALDLSASPDPGGVLFSTPAPPHGSRDTPPSPFRVIERGINKYIETSVECGGERILLAGDSRWRNYRVRAVLTPLSFDFAAASEEIPKNQFSAPSAPSAPSAVNPPAVNADVGICGIVGRWQEDCCVALVLHRDGQLKLLERSPEGTRVLDAKALEYCLGQSLTLALVFSGDKVTGAAGPYAGTTVVSGTTACAHGKVGFIADVRARFGPLNVECSIEDAKESLQSERSENAER